MLPALTTTLGMTLALAWLLGFIVVPFLALWIALSIRRDLRRIADSLDDGKKAYMDTHDLDASDYERRPEVIERHIANSAFGR